MFAHLSPANKSIVKNYFIFNGLKNKNEWCYSKDEMFPDLNIRYNLVKMPNEDLTTNIDYSPSNSFRNERHGGKNTNTLTKHDLSKKQ